MVDVKGERIWKDMQLLCEELGIKITTKDKSVSMKLLAIPMFVIQGFNSEFMTRYTTSAFSTIFFPSEEWMEKMGPRKLAEITAHEIVHIMDQRPWHKGAGFVWRYYFPQLLALLAILGTLTHFTSLNTWPLYFLALAALPWPSTGRSKLEMRAYAVSIAARKWMNGASLSTDEKWVECHLDSFLADTGAFLGWGYYKMCWSRKWVLLRLRYWINLILEDSISAEIPIAGRIKLIMEGTNVEG